VPRSLEKTAGGLEKRLEHPGIFARIELKNTPALVMRKKQPYRCPPGQIVENDVYCKKVGNRRSYGRFRPMVFSNLRLITSLFRAGLCAAYEL
jgi:hypothetical protein